MPNDHYFFVDGSAFLADIKRVQRETPSYAGKLFCIGTFVALCGSDRWLERYHSGFYRRFVFYFVKGDERVPEMLTLPDPAQPGAVDDLRIEYCGWRVRQFKRAQTWLDKNDAPASVRECFYKAEKAVDTQICCDALRLASVGKLDRLFLYTNDSDFLPLFRTLRDLGINANLLRLTKSGVNKKLAAEADAFSVPDEWMLKRCFGVSD